jgi:hypothetical protein
MSAAVSTSGRALREQAMRKLNPLRIGARLECMPQVFG